ncbi:unnamed protein product, partial [Mesorhabditis spiculigera]
MVNWAFGCLFLPLVSAADLFYEHLQFVDWSMDPCHNFYRHVCPETLRDEETVVRKFFDQDLLNYWIKDERKMSALELAIPLAKRHWLSPPDIQEANRAQKFLQALRIRDDVLDYIDQNNLLPQSYYYQVREKIGQIVAVIKDEISNSTYDQMDLATKQFFEGQAANTIIEIGMSNFVSRRFNHTDFYWVLNKLYEAQPTQGSSLSSLRAVVNLVILINKVEGFAIPNANRMLKGIEFGAVNFEGEYVMIPESVCLMARTTSESAWYGSMGVIVAHELQHSLFWDKGQAHNAFTRDQKLRESRECLEDHVMRVCRMFNHDFWNHSTPCIEAGSSSTRVCSCMEAAGKTYTTIYRTQEPAYKDYPEVTNEKMFFYATAAVNCATDPNLHYREGSEHSAKYLRTMAEMTLMPEFRRVFQCSDDSRMGQLSVARSNNCDQYGTTKRRMLQERVLKSHIR